MRHWHTGMAELGIRPDVIELAANHVSGVRWGIGGVYNRSKLLDERRVALERTLALSRDDACSRKRTPTLLRKHPILYISSVRH